MHWIDGIGFAASIAVLASFCMTTIVPLRAMALASNLLFISYGLLAHIYPVLLLHIVLLPVNVFKLQRLLTTKSSSTERLKSPAYLSHN
ncbi:MAG: hypothetical protein JO141_13890 [Bradyrhizobium sp.]|nr:hypothetical protein [Bradyrhizobium sp.]